MLGAFLDEWERILTEARPAKSSACMLDPSEHSRGPQTGFTPFAGVLSADQRADAYRRFRNAEAKRKDTLTQMDS